MPSSVVYSIRRLLVLRHGVYEPAGFSLSLQGPGYRLVQRFPESVEHHVNIPERFLAANVDRHASNER